MNRSIASGDVVMIFRDEMIAWVSPSVEWTFGAAPQHWLGRHFSDLAGPGSESIQRERVAAVVDRGESFTARVEVLDVDGVAHWARVEAWPFVDARGDADGVMASFRFIDDEVAAELEATAQAESRQRAEALHQRLMDSSPIGMTISSPDGRYVAVNEAVCQIFGYSEAELLQMTWQDVTVEENIGPGLYLLDEIFAGRLDTFEFTGQQDRPDELERWSKCGISCLRAPDGTVEYLIGQIIDVTAEKVAQRELSQQLVQNEDLLQRYKLQTERTSADLAAAVQYVESLLPVDLAGPVEVSPRFLPSSELGGDCYDFYWIDQDHLVFYLIDVSGHGVEAALLSMSVHSMLRSGSMDKSTLLAPGRVLATLNERFQMERNRGNYFTVWYGVYQKSTRTLSYASAGHPPALLLTPSPTGVTATQLQSQSMPVGMFDDQAFSSEEFRIPAEAQILLYSDGAFELPLSTGGEWTHEKFVTVCTRLAGEPKNFLDRLTDELAGLTGDVGFNDDCSLVHLSFAGL